MEARCSASPSRITRRSSAAFPAALLLAAGRRLPIRRLLAWAPVFLLLALAPFAYIVWRSYMPPTSHLEMQGHSAAQLWDGMSGAQHRANLMQVNALEHLPWLGSQLLHRQGWLLALALIGLIAGPGPRDRAFLALLAAGNAAFTLVYTVPDLDVYLLPVHLALAPAIALGVQWLGDRFPRGVAIVLCLLVAVSPSLFGPPGRCTGTLLFGLARWPARSTRSPPAPSWFPSITPPPWRSPTCPGSATAAFPVCWRFPRWPCRYPPPSPRCGAISPAELRCVSGATGRVTPARERR